LEKDGKYAANEPLRQQLSRFSKRSAERHATKMVAKGNERP
jgi:hypothetical protein